MTGAVRGLLVTPWFAAATGFVVAAGMWIYSPHAELKFPPSATGGVPCQVGGCGVTAGGGAGALATTTKQRIAHSAKSARGVDGGTAGLTFSYDVVWQSHGKFGMRISVTGKRRTGGEWKLTFALPGDQISAVTGADWHPSGASAGTASGPSNSVTDGQWGNADHGDQGLPAGQDHGISFVVVGQGTPVMPTGCTFNGASCTFS